MHIPVAGVWLWTAIAVTVGATVSRPPEEERCDKIPGFIGKQLSTRVIAIIAIPEQADDVKRSRLQERSHQTPEEFPQCHNVRNIRGDDRCAFVQAHCKGEKVGFLNYLSIYYCGSRRIVSVAAVAWLLMLFTVINISASEFLCGNLSTISNILGMSQSLVSQSFSWP
jgi:sodium/potassium/calcium exchanger 6